MMFRWIIREDGGVLRNAFSRHEIVAAAVEYKDFPIYTASQNLLSSISQGAIIIFLTRYFDISVVGYFAFASRILLVPWSLVYSSLSRVLFQKLSEANNKGQDLLLLFKKSSRGLFLFFFSSGVIGMLLSPTIFALVFGEKWRTAGVYAQWLFVWMIPALVNLPASLGLRVLRRQRALFIYEVVLCLVRFSSLAIATQCSNSPIVTIAAFWIASGLLEIWLLWYGWRTIRHHRGVSSQPSIA